MTSWKTTATSAVALGVALGGSAAFADVTAEQVWADWRGYMSDAGYTVDATESRSGDTLTVSGLTMTMQIPEDDAAVTMTMGDMDFIDNGDGTVSIAIPPELPISISVGGPDSEEADIGLTYASQALEITVSGDPSDLTYDYSAQMLRISLAELVVEGEAVDLAEFGTASLELADLSGATRMQVSDDLRRSEQKVTTGAVAYLMDFSDPEGGDGRFVMRGGADGLDFGGVFSLPPDMDTSEMARMLENGFAFDGTFSFTNGSSEFNFKEDDEVVQGSSRSETGALRVAMDRSGLAYSGNAEGVDMRMAGADIPFPIELAVRESGFNIRMPLMASDAQQPFELGLTLADFTMSDMIWGVFDPAGQLPRDPATVAIDLAGTVKLFFDLLDPEQMEALETGETVPGELDALDINSLTVRAAGAELTGSGAFTFDNTDLTTFDGMPAPTGKANLMLKGGNALLDKLVAMGLLPEDEAMGVRMMMGLFAVPGEGDDTLTSTIEVQGNGQILANGQRIK